MKGKIQTNVPRVSTYIAYLLPNVEKHTSELNQ